jgi:iron complex outermembrane recepter protein
MTLSFSYRFGKTFKSAKPTERAAVEEIQRVGNG